MRRTELWLTAGLGLLTAAAAVTAARTDPRSRSVVALSPLPQIDPSRPPNSFYRAETKAGTHTFRIEVQPEFLRALDAAVPAGNVCEKVRFKKAPLDSLAIDGVRVRAKAFVRYRGFCFPHWQEQKSLKITIDPPGFRGYDTFNLNAMETDPMLFEPWAQGLLERSGGIASRAALVRLFVNGKDDGLRSMIENLDADLLRAQGLPKGALYRELTWAHLGHNDAPDRPYRDVAELQQKWSKNAGPKENWHDWRAFHDAVFDSVVNGTAAYKDVVNEEHYVNYAAVVAITGTEHLNNHNIPMYRPARSAKFIPVGYDFGNAAGALFASVKPWLPEDVQTPYSIQNWLSGLFWTDTELRSKIHRRITEILRHHDPYGLYESVARHNRGAIQADVDAGRIFPWAREHPSFFREVSDLLRARVRHLEKGYLRPVARIHDGYQGLSEFQMLIDGLGVYEVAIDVRPSPCRSGEPALLAVRVHAGPSVNVASCEGGRVAVRAFSAERHDEPREGLRTHRSHVSRNSLGGILVDVGNPQGLAIERIRIRSLQTGETFPPTLPWRFHLRRVAEGRVHLGRLDDFTVHNLNPPAVLAFSTGRGELGIEQYAVAPDRDRTHVGPVLCWDDDGRSGCFELTRAFLFSVDPYPLFASRAPETAASEARIVRPGKPFASGADATFTAGLWQIVEPLTFDARSTVRFEAGARLEFLEDAFLVLRGPVVFPESGPPVEFRGALGKSWGGLVIVGQNEPVLVQNALFTEGNEFVWQGQLMTGALNIVDVRESRVVRCRFSRNLADDGLNVRGGRTEVTDNVFYGNRDGMDFDRGESLVAANLMIDNRDDGVDVGTAARQVTLRGNVIRGSGDKGVSVGEGSVAEIVGNLIERNNVGIAAKDGSRVALRENLVHDNQVGLSVYNKIESTGSAFVSGQSSFARNATTYKEDGVPGTPGAALTMTSLAAAEELRLRGRILDACPSCASGR